MSTFSPPVSVFTNCTSPPTHVPSFVSFPNNVPLRDRVSRSGPDFVPHVSSSGSASSSLSRATPSLSSSRRVEPPSSTVHSLSRDVSLTAKSNDPILSYFSSDYSQDDRENSDNEPHDSHDISPALATIVSSESSDVAESLESFALSVASSVPRRSSSSFSLPFVLSCPILRLPIPLLRLPPCGSLSNSRSAPHLTLVPSPPRLPLPISTKRWPTRFVPLLPRFPRGSG